MKNDLIKVIKKIVEKPKPKKYGTHKAYIKGLKSNRLNM